MYFIYQVVWITRRGVYNTRINYLLSSLHLSLYINYLIIYYDSFRAVVVCDTVGLLTWPRTTELIITMCDAITHCFLCAPETNYYLISLFQKPNCAHVVDGVVNNNTILNNKIKYIILLGINLVKTPPRQTLTSVWRCIRGSWCRLHVLTSLVQSPTSIR